MVNIADISKPSIEKTRGKLDPTKGRLAQVEATSAIDATRKVNAATRQSKREDSTKEQDKPELKIKRQTKPNAPLKKGVKRQLIQQEKDAQNTRIYTRNGKRKSPDSSFDIEA